MTNLKNIFRWIAVVPGALLAGFAATFPIHWAVLLFKIAPDSGDSLITNESGQSVFKAMPVETLERFGYALFIPAVIILAGAHIAPKRHFTVASLLAIIITAFLTFNVRGVFSSTASLTSIPFHFWLTVILWVVSICGATYAIYYMSKNGSMGGAKRETFE